MIYLDSAATSFQKPSEVYRAVYHAMKNFGANAGRGGHRLSVKAGEAVYEAREALSVFFNVSDPSNIAFFPNTTYALNAAIFGTVKRGEHVITTSMEHNSVIRPLAELKKEGKIELTVIEGNEKGRISLDELRRAFKPNTSLVVMTHASNVCGNVYDINAAADISHSNKVPILIDAAQSAGALKTDAEKYDFLAFPGHKGLLGPQGTGGLYVSPKYSLRPLVFGGTGSLSESVYQPKEMPDAFESGTVNMPALAGLTEGVRFIMREGIENIHNYEMSLFNLAYESFKNMKNIVCYGDFEKKERVGVLSFNIKGVDGVEAANELSDKYNIAVRSGLHCAALAHKTLGTQKSGTIRMSFSYFNTKNEVKKAIDAIYEISKGI